MSLPVKPIASKARATTAWLSGARQRRRRGMRRKHPYRRVKGRYWGIGMGSFVTCRRRLLVSRRYAAPGLHTPVPGVGSRLNSIGCVLYNHNRDKVIGKIIRAWVENGRGMAEVEFDDDPESDTIYKKVKSGSLKGVSVGYMVNMKESEDVRAGKKSEDGRFTGPCRIRKKWQPFEISVVSIPADSTVGVGRDLETAPAGAPLSVYEWQLQINKNIIGGM